jgi:methylenetetrahydrofolate dehydrogenase (NADP+)/methenyltetrahydrofolate cyclohydrolase
VSAQILDGAAIARAFYDELAPRIQALIARGVRPGLTTLLVGDNAASGVYVRNKLKRCEALGLRGELRQLPADSDESDVIAALEQLNRDPRVHGIIVQLPLPKSVDARHVTQAIALEKDVDGFNWMNLGALVEGRAEFVPCTPAGVMRILDHANVPLEGRHAVVIGRSSIVGKPLALMLITRGATVTVCNSKTSDLGSFTRSADIVVAATGHAGLVTVDMVKQGAVVIDVGINRLADGAIVGDVEYSTVKETAGAITPVPGGVGPMTIAMLIGNTVLAAERLASA